MGVALPKSTRQQTRAQSSGMAHSVQTRELASSVNYPVGIARAVETRPGRTSSARLATRGDVLASNTPHVDWLQETTPLAGPVRLPPLSSEESSSNPRSVPSPSLEAHHRPSVAPVTPQRQASIVPVPTFRAGHAKKPRAGAAQSEGTLAPLVASSLLSLSSRSSSNLSGPSREDANGGAGADHHHQHSSSSGNQAAAAAGEDDACDTSLFSLESDDSEWRPAAALLAAAAVGAGSSSTSSGNTVPALPPASASGGGTPQSASSASAGKSRRQLREERERDMGKAMLNCRFDSRAQRNIVDMLHHNSTASSDNARGGPSGDGGVTDTSGEAQAVFSAVENRSGDGNNSSSSASAPAHGGPSLNNSPSNLGDDPNSTPGAAIFRRAGGVDASTAVVQDFITFVSQHANEHNRPRVSTWFHTDQPRPSATPGARKRNSCSVSWMPLELREGDPLPDASLLQEVPLPAPNAEGRPQPTPPSTQPPGAGVPPRRHHTASVSTSGSVSPPGSSRRMTPGGTSVFADPLGHGVSTSSSSPPTEGDAPALTVRQPVPILVPPNPSGALVSMYPTHLDTFSAPGSVVPLPLAPADPFAQSAPIALAGAFSNSMRRRQIVDVSVPHRKQLAKRALDDNNLFLFARRDPGAEAAVAAPSPPSSRRAGDVTHGTDPSAETST